LHGDVPADAFPLFTAGNYGPNSSKHYRSPATLAVTPKMKTLALYSIAAIMYVTGGALMKYSQGLTQVLPTLGLTALFSTGALIQARAMRYEQLGSSYVVVLGLEALLAITLGGLLFGEQLSARAVAGIALVVIGIVLLRFP
jgi:multidrug resistance protein EbrB